MFALAQLLPVLAYLVVAPLAIPTDYYPAPAAAPAPASGGEYSEQKQHDVLWASWSDSSVPAPATAHAAAPASSSAAAAPAQGVSSGPSPAGEWPKYGSGSLPVTDLNSCLQMCQATYGAPSHAAPAPPAASHTGAAPPPPPAAAPPPSPAVDNASPATHTIIVAPTMGVLRFVPFSVTAKQGDSLEFVWGAGPHTATLSQGQNVCNKSLTAESFDSGKLNATAKYIVKVNSTTPTFHYCTVGMHCANGMFGVVNPPTTNVTSNLTQAATKTSNAPGAGSTAGSGSGGCNGDRMDCWVATWAASSPEASKTVSAVQKACEKSNTDAWKWGAGIDMSTMLGNGVTKENVIENVMYTRLMMSMNPSMLNPSSSASSSNTTSPAGAVSFIAAPDLKSFVAQSDLNATAPAGSASGSIASGPGVSASASAAGSAESDTAAANASSGAGRIGAPVVLLSAVVAGLTALL